MPFIRVHGKVVHIQDKREQGAKIQKRGIKVAGAGLVAGYSGLAAQGIGAHGARAMKSEQRFHTKGAAVLAQKARKAQKAGDAIGYAKNKADAHASMDAALRAGTKGVAFVKAHAGGRILSKAGVVGLGVGLGIVGYGAFKKRGTKPAKSFGKL